MKNLILIALSVTLALALVVPVSHAGELAGVTLDDTMRVGDRTVTLSGMGIRTKTFLKVKVYVAGLYLESPVKNAQDIIGSDQAKAMVMSFLYKEVEREKLQESWRSGFDANTPSAGPDLIKKMDQFVSLFQSPAMNGDKYLFIYEPGKGTSIILKGETMAVIPGADFASALMAIWFGDNLGDGGLKALKKSLLEGM